MNGDLFPVPLIFCRILTVINGRLLTKGKEHKWKFETFFSLENCSIYMAHFYLYLQPFSQRHKKILYS